MPMYNLIEYSENYSKTSGILFQYCRDEPATNNNNNNNNNNIMNLLILLMIILLIRLILK